MKKIIRLILVNLDEVIYWPCPHCVEALALSGSLIEFGVLTEEEFDSLEKWLQDCKKGKNKVVTKLKRILRSLES